MMPRQGVCVREAFPENFASFRCGSVMRMPRETRVPILLQSRRKPSAESAFFVELVEGWDSDGQYPNSRSGECRTSDHRNPGLGRDHRARRPLSKEVGPSTRSTSVTQLALLVPVLIR